MFEQYNDIADEHAYDTEFGIVSVINMSERGSIRDGGHSGIGVGFSQSFDMFTPISQNESNDQLIQRLDVTHAWWVDPTCDNQPDSFQMQRARYYFQIGGEEELVVDRKIEELWKLRIEHLEALNRELRERKLANDESDDPEVAERARKIGQLRRLITLAYTAISAIANMRDASNSRARPLIPPGPMEIMSEIEVDANDPTKKKKKFVERQKFIVFMLDYCYRHRLRKDKLGQAYYREIQTQDHSGSHAWKREGSLMELVFQAVQPRSAYTEAWRCQTYQASLIRGVVDYLAGCRDPEFPVLEKDRRIWSFENGVYISVRDQFLPYGDPRLTDAVVSCKFIAVQFKNTEYEEQMRLPNGKLDWLRIDTKEIDDIMTDQDLPDAVMEWLYVFFGRMAYKVNEFDIWQCQLFLKGVAGTGKSSLLQQLIFLWDPTDVAILSNTTEKMFPLEALLHVFAYFGLDISNSLQLDQTLWQSMVTGEGVAVNRKFKERISVEWEVGGMLAGNQTPPWKDNAGSVSRRLLIAAFLNTIDEAKVRGDLNKELRLKVGAFIKKISVAYRTVVSVAGMVGIWKMLPDYFRETRELLRQQTNILDAYLSSPRIKKGQHLKCPESVFTRDFQQFVNGQGKTAPEWQPEFYIDVFAKSNPRITRKVVENETYNNHTLAEKHVFLYGVDLTTNFMANQRAAQDAAKAADQIRKRQQEGHSRPGVSRPAQPIAVH